MTALEACGRLSQLKRFPQGPLAVASIAETIDKYLKQDQIEPFVDALCLKYDEWPGPATFAAECRAVNAKSDATTSLTEFKSWGAKPAVTCALCDDWGHVQRNGRYERCVCENGYALDAEYLRMLNCRTAIERGKEKSVLRPVTQADVDAIKERRR